MGRVNPAALVPMLAQQVEQLPPATSRATVPIAAAVLVLKVPTRAVMGWSNANMTKRYQHVPIEVLTGIAAQVGGLFCVPDTDERGDDDGTSAGLVPTA